MITSNFNSLTFLKAVPNNFKVAHYTIIKCIKSAQWDLIVEYMEIHECQRGRKCAIWMRNTPYRIFLKIL
jgi:hypothetical protein